MYIYGHFSFFYFLLDAPREKKTLVHLESLREYIYSRGELQRLILRLLEVKQCLDNQSAVRDERRDCDHTFYTQSLIVLTPSQITTTIFVILVDYLLLYVNIGPH